MDEKSSEAAPLVQSRHQKRVGKKPFVIAAVVMAVVLLAALLGANLVPADSGPQGSAAFQNSATPDIVNDRSPATDLVSRLKNGDTSLCTDPQVERTALTTIVYGPTLELFERDGGRLTPFEDVSALGINQDVSEVSCSARLAYNGGHSNAFEYDVRPSLDQSGGIVVETKVSFADKDNLDKYITIYEEGLRYRQQQQENTAVEVEANGADVEQAPEDDAKHQEIVDENGAPIT